MCIEFSVPLDFKFSSHRLLWPGEAHFLPVSDELGAFESLGGRQGSVTNDEGVASRAERLVTAGASLDADLC